MNQSLLKGSTAPRTRARVLGLTFMLCFSLACQESGEPSSHGSDVDAASMPDMAQDGGEFDMNDDRASVTLKVATFNASLFRSSEGELIENLNDGDESARQVARVIQEVRPDVILINEFDYDPAGEAVRIFREGYLNQEQEGGEPLDYEYGWAFESNTGLHSGFDLDGNGEVVDTPGSQNYGNDAFGFGVFEGQYAFAVFSRFPMAGEPREFRELLWSSMPENRIPDGFYSEEAREVLRLSSKNHVDIPIDIGGHTLHLLASHPTPPAFDGDEQRNVRRNHDEVRFWNDYISGADWIVDDAGQEGGLAPHASFVVVGDLNLDPNDGDSMHEAIVDLLAHERTRDAEPSSQGAVVSSENRGRVNTNHRGDPALDTAEFNASTVGNLRVDYAIPSSDLSVLDTEVFWPAPGEPGADLVDVSDHRLVWVSVSTDE